MDLRQRYRVNEPNVIHETIQGETVIINLMNGRYYSLQDTAADLWNLLTTGASVEAMVRAATSRYAALGTDVVGAAAAFLEQLKADDLIRLDGLSDPTAPSQAGSTDQAHLPAFKPPVLHRYTDMEDLLLLDPIHDVDEAGWPVAKADTPPEA